MNLMKNFNLNYLIQNIKKSIKENKSLPIIKMFTK